MLPQWPDKRMGQRTAVQQAQDAIQEIDSIGVQVKDLDKGSAGFSLPGRRADRPPLLATRRSKN